MSCWMAGQPERAICVGKSYHGQCLATLLPLLKAGPTMYRPMATRPFHCLHRVSLCLLRKGSRSMKGSRATKLNPMWHEVSSRGNLNP